MNINGWIFLSHMTTYVISRSTECSKIHKRHIFQAHHYKWGKLKIQKIENKMICKSGWPFEDGTNNFPFFSFQNFKVEYISNRLDDSIILIWFHYLNILRTAESILFIFLSDLNYIETVRLNFTKMEWINSFLRKCIRMFCSGWY